jgi:hypothetical protein
MFDKMNMNFCIAFMPICSVLQHSQICISLFGFCFLQISKVVLSICHTIHRQLSTSLSVSKTRPSMGICLIIADKKCQEYQIR